MDNKQEIEMIRCLIANYGSYLDDKTAGYNNHDLCKALMKAIKSLEAWDKVKKEIKEIKTTDVNRCKTMAVHIINKHLKEIEE